MIKKNGQVSRKMLNEDRIAICPHFGCPYLKKVKPLKFGVIGFRKYPKCSKHKIPLVFVDEFIGNFFHAVRACFYDRSSLPPEQLINVIKTKIPNELKAFIIGWLYCNPIGRGAKIVSNYMDSLSRGYMKSLSRKQRKSLTNERKPKKNYEKLRLGLKKIAMEYANFLRELREKSEIIWNSKELHPLSVDGRNFLKIWLKGHLNEIQLARGKKKTKSYMQDDPLRLLKEEYDKILHAGTCSSLLGISPDITTKGVSPFELFSSYYEFLKSGLCIELTKEEIKSLLEKNLDEIEEETERKNIGVRKLKSNNKVYKWDNIVNLKRIFKVLKCDIEIGKISKTIEDISKSTGIYLDRLKEFCEIDEVEKLKDKFSPNDFIKIGESIGYEKYVQVNNPHRKNEKIRIYFKRPYEYVNKILNNKKFFDIYTKGLRTSRRLNNNIPVINVRWNKLVRKDLWSEIDAFITKQMTTFKSFNDLNRFENLKRIVLNHLESVYGAQLNNIITSKSEIIQASIVMIYLHRLNNINEKFGRNVLSGNDIAKKVGYKKEPHWANILKMNLGLSKDLPQTRFYTEINKIINVLGKDNSIDACIRIIKYIDGKKDEDIKLKKIKIKEIKNYFLNLTNDVFYNYLSEESKIYENKHNISDKIIITTYLLKSEHLLKSRDIIKISGIGYNLLDVLSEFLGIYTSKDNINYLSKERICIRCKEKKEFKEFFYFRRKNNPTKSQISRLCLSCIGITKRTEGFKKKILAMIYLKLKKEKGINRNEFLRMVDGIKKGKVKKFHLNLGCSYKISGQICDVDLNLLPIYDLHHKDPAKKTRSWSYLADLKLSKILEILDNDGEVEFICGNDHSYETAKTIRLYLKGILSTSLKDVNHKFPLRNRLAIESAIKKRMILQEEYGEYCVNCGQIGIDPYLAAIHFHHKTKILKLYSFTKHLRYIKDIEEIRDIMRRALQVPYCQNCHQMKKVKYFEDYKRDIFSEYLDDNIVNELLKKDKITN